MSQDMAKDIFCLRKGHAVSITTSPRNFPVFATADSSYILKTMPPSSGIAKCNIVEVLAFCHPMARKVSENLLNPQKVIIEKGAAVFPNKDR
jgi:hypothetical protein